MPTPHEIETAEVFERVAASLPAPPATVLEVGCGRGSLALRLAAGGWRVTAIDSDSESVEAARSRGAPAERADFLTFEKPPFDALLFTRSLHHIWPLDDAVRRARELLAPGGALILDEVALDEVDRFTATWFFDLQLALELAGAIEPPHHDHHHHHGHHRGPPPSEPLERWKWRVAHDPPLHGARAMLDGLTDGFAQIRIERGPALYGNLSDSLPDSSSGGELFAGIRSLESERIDQGVLVATGLWVVAGRSA